MNQLQPSDLFSEYILARIASGEYRVGTKLPSIRRLAMKFNLSYSSAQRRVATLSRHGLIRSSRGRGLFVAKTNLLDHLYAEKRLIAFITQKAENDPTKISYVALLAFQQCAARAGYKVDLRPLRFYELQPENFSGVTEGYAGAAMFTEYDSALSFFPGTLPAVGVLMNHSFGGRLSLVNIDPASAADLAVAYFRRHGLRKITVCSSLKPVYRERSERFCERWRQHGGSCSIDYSEAAGDKFVRDRGYLFSSDTWLHSHHLAYRKRTGRNLSEDFTVLGIDGKHRLNPDWPPFPSIVADWTEIGQLMFEELKRLMDHPDSPRRNLMLSGRLAADLGSNFTLSPDDVANDEATLSRVDQIIETIF